MKIVITGALGHIGSFLIRRIPRQMPGADIVMVDNLITQRYCSLFHLPKEGRFQFYQADVIKDDISQFFHKSDAAVHLAALTDPSESFVAGSQEFEMNFEATRKVADACIDARVPLVFISSTSVYDGQEGKISESLAPSRLSPRTPYARSKLREELLLAKLGKEKDLCYTVLRFGTICGVSPGMRFHTVVNRFCFQAAMRQPITVWKTAMEQTRPYLDVTDAAEAIIHVIRENCFDGSIYNIATDHRTVGSIIQRITSHIKDIQVVMTKAKAMTEGSFTVSCARFREKGWCPQGDIDRCIDETIALLNNNYV